MQDTYGCLSSQPDSTRHYKDTGSRTPRRTNWYLLSRSSLNSWRIRYFGGSDTLHSRINHTLCGSEPKQEFHWRSQAAVHSIQPTSGHRSSCHCAAKTDTIFICALYLNPSLIQKTNHVRVQKHCYNCLGVGHQTRECQSMSRCKKCSGKHNTIITPFPLARWRTQLQPQQ